MGRRSPESGLSFADVMPVEILEKCIPYLEFTLKMKTPILPSSQQGTSMTRTTSLFTLLLAAGLIIGGCSKESSTSSNTKNTGGLFKSEGTFSFSSNRGNLTATGIFDTLMQNSSASGAFKYTQGTKTAVMIVAYNVVSSTNMSMAFLFYMDTLNATNVGTYSFELPKAKAAVFGYIPNMMDTTGNALFFVLTKGSVNVTALSESATAGNFTGTGYDVSDTLKTITLTNGSFQTPVVDHYYDVPGDNSKQMPEMVRERAHVVMKKLMSAE